MANKFISKILVACIIASSFMNTISYASAKPKTENVDPLKVEIMGIVVPVSNGRRLVNYAFFSLTIYAKDSASANNLRLNPFLVKDKIVKDFAKAPISYSGNGLAVDVKAMTVRIKPLIEASMPNAKVGRLMLSNPEFMKRN